MPDNPEPIAAAPWRVITGHKRSVVIDADGKELFEIKKSYVADHALLAERVIRAVNAMETMRDERLADDPEALKSE